MRILAPLGAEGPIDRPSRSADAEGLDWVNWYAWSLRRQLPLPDRVVDKAYLAAVRDTVRSAEIAGQASYHVINARRIAKLDHRIHHTGQALFGTTAALCIYLRDRVGDRLPGRYEISPPRLGPRLIHLPDGAPADARRGTGRDLRPGRFQDGGGTIQATAKRLAAVDKILAEEPLEFARLADRVQKTSDIMMADLEEWQTVFRTRPLSLPA